MTGQPQDRDERTGVGRERANAAYVAARASRDAWPRNEKTGAELRRPSWTRGEGLDPALLNELAYLIEGDGFVELSLRYGAAARILNAGWTPPAPVSAGEPTQEARHEQ